MRILWSWWVPDVLNIVNDAIIDDTTAWCYQKMVAHQIAVRLVENIDSFIPGIEYLTRKSAPSKLAFFVIVGFDCDFLVFHGGESPFKAECWSGWIQ